MTEASPSFRTVFRRLVADGNGWVLLVVTGSWFMFFGMRLVLPALVPQFRITFDLSLTSAGWLLSVLGVSYAAGQFPGGVLSDRFGERTIMIGSAAAAGTAVTLLALSPGVGLLFVGTFVFGIAAALFSPARYVIVSKLYTSSDGTAMSIVSAGGNLGASALPAAAGILATIATWRLGFGLIASAFVLVVVGLWYVIPAPRPPASGGQPSKTDGGEALSTREFIRSVSKPSILLVATILVCHSFIFQGFTAFYPTYLVDQKGISSGLSATLFSLFFATGIVTKIVVGPSGDVFGKPATIGAMFAGLSTALLVLPFVEGVPALVGATLLMTCLLGIVPVATALLTNELSDHVAGSGLGLLRTLYTLAGATSPVLVGTLADRGQFDAAFGLFGGVALFGLCLCLFIVSRR